MDEVGRGTSPREGLGISHAIAEALLKLKVGDWRKTVYIVDLLLPLALRLLCNVSCQFTREGYVLT